MNNPFSLEGKTILVTGASSGIGRSTAIECSKLGAKIVAMGRNEHRLQDTMSNLAFFGHSMFIADLTDACGVAEVIASLPPLDGVVNAAGIASTILFQFATPEKMRNMFETNFFAPVEFTRLLLKKKLIRKGGSIVFFLQWTARLAPI